MNSSEVREKGGVSAGVRWSLVMGLFGELRSGPVFVQRSEPGVEDQAGADGTDTKQARGPMGWCRWLATGETCKVKGLASAKPWPRLEGQTQAQDSPSWHTVRESPTSL